MQFSMKPNTRLFGTTTYAKEWVRWARLSEDTLPEGNRTQCCLDCHKGRSFSDMRESMNECKEVSIFLLGWF